MKRFLQILLILALLSLAAVQILIHTGLLLPKEKEPVCPVSAIKMINGKAVIDSTKCIGCRRCVDGVLIPKQATPMINVPLSDSIGAPQVSVPESSPIPAPNPRGTQPVTAPPGQVAQVSQGAQVSQAYQVDPDKCIGCQLCVPNCPVGAITMQDGKAVIDKSKCISCGICEEGNGDDFQGCPTGAISKS